MRCIAKLNIILTSPSLVVWHILAMSTERALPPFVKPPKKDYPTRFVFVSNADTNCDTLEHDLIQNFIKFGDLDYNCGPIFINYKRVC